MSSPDKAISFLEMRTDAVLGSIRVLNELLEVALTALGIVEAQRHDVALGLAELVANVCQHETSAGGDGRITVSLDARSNDLVLRVVSEGPPFDLQDAIEKAANRDPLADLDGSGLGLPLLVALFDSLECSHDGGQGNQITLTKKRA